MNKYEVLHQALSRGLLSIADMISPEYKLTLIARHPTNPNAHAVITHETDWKDPAYLLLHPECMPVETK